MALLASLPADAAGDIVAAILLQYLCMVYHENSRKITRVGPDFMNFMKTNLTMLVPSARSY